MSSNKKSVEALVSSVGKQTSTCNWRIPGKLCIKLNNCQQVKKNDQGEASESNKGKEKRKAEEKQTKSLKKP